MNLFLLALLLAFVAPTAQANREPAPSVDEPLDWYAERVPTDSSAPASPLGEPVANRIDVRGVGDTAWSNASTPEYGEPTPPRAAFDTALRKVDPSGALLRGDLNFLNWESVVGEYCDSIRTSVDFYFLSHPDAIRQAIQKGFNLISFANNHAQDCNLGQSTLGAPPVRGPLMTSENLARLTREMSEPFVWAGVTHADAGENAFTVRVVPFVIGGRTVRVALGSVATLGWDIPAAATIQMAGGPAEEMKIDRLVKNFKAADADFRVLSIHTQDTSGNGRPEGPAFRMLKHISERFIREAAGDVVFGEGPHTWGGVKVVERADGKRGVIFTSLGNFLHAGLRSDSDNYVARGLWDRETLRLREVQVHPYKNLRTSLALYSAPSETKMPNANFEWELMYSRANGKRTVGYSARFR